MPDRAVAPFARGRTFYHGKTVDSSDLPGGSVVGQVHVFQDTDPANETKLRSNGDVVAIAVRNVSGISLLPKRVVTFKVDAIGKEVDGYCEVINERVAGIVDDHLPSSGCPDDDVCWIIVKGPCLAITSFVNMAANMAVNDPVHAKAAASSTAGTAVAGGRFDRLAEGALTGDAGLLRVNSVIGYAMTARLLAVTNTDTLINVQLR
tara:strand:- start:5142 stop:5759 length:618 start_codon:yes stop_codon:yes gene_type:complete